LPPKYNSPIRDSRQNVQPFPKKQKSDKSVAERELADLKTWRKAQKELFDRYIKAKRDDRWLKWAQSIIEIHIQLAKTVQREQFLEEKPPASNRLKGWGHCTLECACCNRFRGFKSDP
jgi:hypothetical protein